MLNLGSTKTGVILLWGLFLYDVWWVFFTPVMVAVATKIDGPIKLLFPTRSLDRKFNMLGLGDIVIPGAHRTFTALLHAAHTAELKRALERCTASLRPHVDTSPEACRVLVAPGQWTCCGKMNAR